MDTVTEVLIGAKKRIKRGWTQGTLVEFYRDGIPCYCPIGAIEAEVNSLPKAMNSVVEFDAAVTGACDMIRKVIPGHRIPPWNDDKKRKKKDVLAAFDRAIALSKKKPKKQKA